jgi:hypothetical protein
VVCAGSGRFLCVTPNAWSLLLRYIYTAFRSVAVDSYSPSFPLVHSRSVVPWVLEANECLAIVVGSEHQLFDLLAACSWSKGALSWRTYEKPH